MLSTPQTTDGYKEYRCQHDNKLLFKGILVDGEIEVKCRSCHQLTTLKGDPQQTLICKVTSCEHRKR